MPILDPLVVQASNVLIDGDMIAYKAAAHAEEGIDWDGDGFKDYYADAGKAEAHAVKTLLGIILALTPSNPHPVLCFTGKENFRKKILPTYKMNRAGKHKPKLLGHIREWLFARYKTECWEGLEADDVMGIMSTREPGKWVIAAEDKDMRQIPGWNYNPRTGESVLITPEEATRWHYMQTLMGDPGDGYSGCPWVGKVRAAKILDVLPGCEWAAICIAFMTNRKVEGLTEADALVQARVAKILHDNDYDEKEGQPILWEPPRYPTATKTMKTVASTPGR